MFGSSRLIFALRTVVVTKQLTSGNLFSNLATFVLRTVVVTKPLTSGIIFYQYLKYFSPDFVDVLSIDLPELN